MLTGLKTTNKEKKNEEQEFEERKKLGVITMTAWTLFCTSPVLAAFQNAGIYINDSHAKSGESFVLKGVIRSDRQQTAVVTIGLHPVSSSGSISSSPPSQRYFQVRVLVLARRRSTMFLIQYRVQLLLVNMPW